MKPANEQKYVVNDVSGIDPKVNYPPKFEQWVEKGVDMILKKGWLFRALSFMRLYTQLTTEGLENIPKSGPVIIVPNHSGVWGWDGMVLQNELFQKIHRIPRTMLHNFWFKNQKIKDVASQLGYIPQDFKMALRLLRRGKLMLLFPEAEAGNFKSSIQMYQMQAFNPGFISLAILSRATIVPCCVLGAEEAHLNLGTLGFTKKWFGLKIPLPLNIIPLPVKWKFIFLKGFKMDKYEGVNSRDQKFLVECAENVRMRIQERIDKELKKRKPFTFIWEP